AWFQESDECEEKAMVIVQIEGRQGQGNKQFFVGWVIETWRQHTDHCVALLVEHDRTTHHAWFCAKLSLPHSVTEQDDLGGAFPLFFRREIPTVQRPHAKRRQQAGRDSRAIDPLRYAAASQVECGVHISAELRKSMVLRRQVAEIRSGEAAVADQH